MQPSSSVYAEIDVTNSPALSIISGISVNHLNGSGISSV